MPACCWLRSPVGTSGAADDRFGPRRSRAPRPTSTEPDVRRRTAIRSPTASRPPTSKPTSRSRICGACGFGRREREALTRTPDGQRVAAAMEPGRHVRSPSSPIRRRRKTTTTQVWLMPRFGGKARKLTDFPGGVEDFAWSPDGKRLAVIAQRSRAPAGATKPKNPPPIVTERYQFKEDGTGYLTARRKHLYLFDIASGKGRAADSRRARRAAAGLVARRQADRLCQQARRRPGSPPQLRHLPGRAGSRRERAPADHLRGRRPRSLLGIATGLEPGRRRIAYLQGGEDKWIYYAPWQLAVVDVASGKAHAARADRPLLLQAALGRPTAAVSTPDRAEPGHASVAHRPRSRQGHAADRGAAFRLRLRRRRDGRIAVLGGDDRHPYELSAVERGGCVPLTDHNSWLDGKRLAPVEDIKFKSADGTAIDGFLVKPVGYQAGTPLPDDPAHARRSGLPVQPRIHGRLAGVCRAGLRGGRSKSARRLRPRLRLRPRDLRRLGQQGRRRTSSPASTMW